MKLYCQMTSQLEVPSACLFQKTQILDQSYCCKEEKNEPVCSSGRFEAATIQLAQGGEYCYCHQAPIHRFTKICFPAVSKLCKDTPRTSSTIPWEKRSGERVLWILTAINVATLLRWNVLSDDFRVKSEKEPFLPENSNTWPKLLF